MNTQPAKIGYARTSTKGQNLDTQIAALRDAGCDVIRTEQRSGDGLSSRSELETILAFIRTGDTLVVTRIDRLARSLHDLQSIALCLKARGVHLTATEQPINTATAAGKAFFDMLGVFAEFETNLRRERQVEGIENAKRKGVYKGRPSKIDLADIRARLAQGATPTSVAAALSISRGTIYRALKEGRASEAM